MRKLTVSAFITLAVLVVAACDDDTKEDASTEARTSFAQQYCDATGATCCPMRGDDPYEATTCRTLIYLGGTTAEINFDQAAGDACLAALRSAQAQGSFCFDYGGAPVQEACGKVFANAKPLGGACRTDPECAPNPGGDVGCAAEGCTLYPRGKEGDACSGDKLARAGALGSSIVTFTKPVTSVCWETEGLYCGAAGGNAGTCRKRAAIDAPCADDGLAGTCVTGAFCSSGKCVALEGVGAECSDSKRCAGNAFCDAATSKCAALVPAGGACADDGQCGALNSCEKGKCVHFPRGLSLFACTPR